MKGLSFSLLISLVIVVACIGIGSVSGCGGGLIPAPPVQNLSAIQGQWDYVLDYEGTTVIDGVSTPTGNQVTGYFIITPDTVTDESGNPWWWGYDGVTLSLSCHVLTTIPVGGDIQLAESTALEMLLPPDAIDAEVVGTFAGILTIAGTVFESTNQVITGLIQKGS